MIARSVNAAADVITRAMQNGRQTPAGWAMALDAACMIQTPEKAAEHERLRARVDEVERKYAFDTAALKRRIGELEQQLAAKDRPADEDPIAYALTEEAEADCDHPNGYGPYGCAGCGAFRPPADEEDVTPQVRKLRDLLAGQRDAVAAEAGER